MSRSIDNEAKSQTSLKLYFSPSKLSNLGISGHVTNSSETGTENNLTADSGRQDRNLSSFSQNSLDKNVGEMDFIPGIDITSQPSFDEDHDSEDELDLSQQLSQPKVDFDKYYCDDEQVNKDNYDGGIDDDLLVQLADSAVAQAQAQATTNNGESTLPREAKRPNIEKPSTIQNARKRTRIQERTTLFNQKINTFCTERGKTRSPQNPNMRTCRGKDYFMGDTWSSPRDKDLCDYFFTISDFKRRGIHLAAVIGSVSMPLSKTYIGEEESKQLVNKRKSEGKRNPAFARFISTQNLLDQGCLPLQALTDRSMEFPRNNQVMPDILYQKGTEGKEFNKGFTCAYSYEQVPVHEIFAIHQENPVAIDLFAGAGGMSKGLERAGWDVQYKVEINPAAVSTLMLNYPNSIVFNERVENFLDNCKARRSQVYPTCRNKISLVHASTPCQGVSNANRYGGKNDDYNNSMTMKFVEAVEYFRPAFAIFENVNGMTKKKHKHLLQKMIKDLLLTEYQVRLCIVDASDYGDPQCRQRVIVFAAKKGVKLPDFPQPTHGDLPNLKKKVTVGDVWDILEDVEPVLESGLVDLHDGRLVWDHSKEGTAMPSDLDKVCHTIRNKPASNTVTKTNFFKHYKKNRVATIRELALLQGFPIDYKFCGKHSEKRDQIGNAVPVNLAFAVASTAMTAYNESYPKIALL